MTNRQLAKFYQVPLTLKERKETTAKKELEEIWYKTGDKVLEKVMEIRSLDTNLNNYIPNWKPTKDGSVHTTWGFTAPSGQFDSRSPNVLNCSKHTAIGQLFRRIVEAPKGYTFVEFDKRSFHVATMGYCANDPDYIRFSQLDPHSIFTSWIMPKDWGSAIELSMSDGEILERCDWIKKRCKQEKEKDPIHGVNIRQSLSKPVVLGNQLGLGPRKLYRQNRRFMRDENHARELQAKLGEKFSKEEIWKDDIRQEAHDKTFLYLKEWGRVQHFFDVFTYKYNKRTRLWERGYGGDSEKALAFPVQGQAFGMIQWELRKLEKLGANEWFNFLVSIHDSLMYMPRDEDLERCIEMVYGVMSMPCGRMVNKATGPLGLKVGVEVSVGKNWANWDKDMNIEGMREFKI